MSTHCILILCVICCVWGQSIPPEWQDGINEGNILYTPITGNLQQINPQNMPALANGYLGMLALSNSTFISGVYSGLKGHTPSHRARIPSRMSLFIIDSTPFQAALDMEHGEFLLRSSVGSSNCTVQQTIYAHQEFRNCLVHEISLVDSNCASVSFTLFQNSGDSSDDISFVTETLPTDPYQIYDGYIDQTETPTSERVQVVEVSTTILDSYTLEYNNPLLFLSVFSTSLDSDSPVNTCIKDYNTLFGYGAKNLTEHHRNTWSSIWSSGGIEIMDNINLAQKVNATLFAILSAVREDWNYGMSPGGISTNAYNGHVFWDMETWVYPSLLLLQPNLAESILTYRANRISTAQQKASFYNLNGTWFPWESAFTGVEVCPFDKGKNTEGLLEIHINGDISFAVVQYLRCQENPNIQNSSYSQIILNVAEFFASRVHWNGSVYEILNVQPPDESAGRVNNSVYTNSIAKLSLQNAISLSNDLGQSYPSTWQDIVDKMYIPFNESMQGHPEYDGYSGEKINQADVILMQYPLGIQMSKSIAYNDLEYYQRKTRKNGYFTGDNAYSIAWLGINEYQKAVVQYERSFTHIKGPFNVWWEKVQGGHSHFITGAGGFLQNFVFGFGGIRIEEDSLKILPFDIPNTSGFKLRDLNYKSSGFDFTYTNQTLTLTHKYSTPLCVQSSSGEYYQVNNDSIFLNEFPIYIVNPSNC